MTDHFALLDEPRRPWIDPAELKQKFLARSAQCHPDRVHNASAAERGEANRRHTGLNAAYNCLRNPKERLRHLLELERGVAPAETRDVTAETAEMFFEVSSLLKQIDEFLRRKATLLSPVLRAEAMEPEQEFIARLQAMQQKINGRVEGLCAELQRMNTAWDARTPDTEVGRKMQFDHLEETYRLLGYLGRWQEGLRERMTLLAE